MIGHVAAVELDEPTGDAVASAMISSLRDNAPIASVIGEAASPLDGDEVKITFKAGYNISMQDGDPIISGGEESRLTAFFDKYDRLHVVSNGGTISKSVLVYMSAMKSPTIRRPRVVSVLPTATVSLPKHSFQMLNLA